MLKIFVSLFLLCMCALSFVASAELVIDQSCAHELALVDTLHFSPDAAAESDGIGVDAVNSLECKEISLTANKSVSGILKLDAPERYDKLGFSA